MRERDTVTENTQNDQTAWQPLERDYKVGEMVEGATVYQFQFQDEDGRWRVFDSAKGDRDTVTRSQAFGLQERPKERQRVLRFVACVDEIVGHGEDETSPDDVIARNEENTKRLLQAETDAAKRQ